MREIDLGDIVADIQATVVERRRRGDYPIGLEQQLDAEFTAMLRAVERDEIDASRLDALVDGVAASVHGITSDVPTSSRIPLGSAVHATTAKLVERHTATLAANVRGFASAVTEALRETQRLVEAQRAADERQLHDVIAAVLDRLAVLDHLVEVAQDLDERLARIEAAPPIEP